MGLLVGQLLQGKCWCRTSFSFWRILVMQTTHHASFVPQPSHFRTVGRLRRKLSILWKHVLCTVMDAIVGKGNRRTSNQIVKSVLIVIILIFILFVNCSWDFWISFNLSLRPLGITTSDRVFLTREHSEFHQKFFQL
jgi:hypothetical protein